MPNFSPASIELKTSVVKAPANGVISSREYNALQLEILNDLSEITTFLNEQLMPLLSALPSGAADGLHGGAIYADISAATSLFVDSAGNRYTVSEVLAALSSLQTALGRRMDEIAGRLTALTSRLALDDTNDLRVSLQGVQDSYQGVSSLVSRLAADVSLSLLLSGKSRAVLVDLPAAAAGPVDVAVSFTPSFTENYAVCASIDGTSGITVSEITRVSDGSGVIVTVVYDGTNPSGSLNVIARAL